jgi:glycosyltransferase involved in cell wall biosynthesis
MRAAHPYPLEGIVVLSVGRLERYKQVDVAVRATCFLDERFSLIVVGRGPELERLRALAARTSGRATVLGYVDDESLRRWYRTAAVSCRSQRGRPSG